MHKMPPMGTSSQKSGRNGSFVSIAEVAEIYGVHPTTVRRWIMEGRVDAQRVGARLIRLDLENVYQRLGRPTPGV